MRQSDIIQLGFGITKGLSSFSANTKVINWLPCPTPGARSEYELRPLEGSVSVADVIPDAGVGCRGRFRASTGPSPDYSPTLYSVYGNTLFREHADGSTVKVGNVELSSEAVTWAESQGQGLEDAEGFVCDGVTVYKWLLKATDSAVAVSFMEIAQLPIVGGSTSVYARPTSISYSNYHLLLTCGNTNQWYYSDLNGSTFTNGAYYTPEVSADKTVRLIGEGGNLWALGDSSYQLYTPTGISTYPFASPRGQSGRIGCASAQSAAAVGGSVYWLGKGNTATPAVYMGSPDGVVTRISDNDIERIISKWTGRKSAVGFAFSKAGDRYILTSEQDGMTLCYMRESNKWCQLSSGINGTPTAWDVRHITADDDGNLIFGAARSNKICRLDETIGIDYAGRAIHRQWSSPVFLHDLKTFALREIVVDVETGTAPTYAEDATMWVQVSWDAGKTTLNRVIRSLGSRGAYGGKVSVTAQGMGRNLVISFGTSSSVPISVYQLQLVTEVGRA